MQMVVKPSNFEFDENDIHIPGKHQIDNQKQVHSPK